MPTKKELVKKIGKKYTKPKLKKVCKDFLEFKSSITKKDLLKRLSNLKKVKLEEILNPPKIKAKPEEEDSKKLEEEVIRISLKPNKWTVATVGLAVIILVIVAGSYFTPINGGTGAVITYITDDECLDCYDVTINEAIIRTNYGINLSSRTHDISSPEARELITKYSISKIPTFILTGEKIVNNEQLINAWQGVGTVENDNALVFRAPEVISNDFKVLSDEGKFVMYEPPATTIGRFQILENEVCTEDGKPLVYFFGSDSCLHSAWENPVINEVAVLFNDSIKYHDNMGSTSDLSVFNEYSDYNPGGGVPFTIIGCKFIRLGSGETLIFYNDTLSSLNESGYNLTSALNLLSESEEIRDEAMTAYEANDTETYQSLASDYNLLIDNASKLVDRFVLIDLFCNVTGGQPSSVC